MKMQIVLIGAFALFLLCGCGHNISVYSKGVGAELSWRPNTIMPALRMGSYENLDLCQRENNQVRYASNTAVGFNWFGLKSLFGGGKTNDVGVGTVFEVKTGPMTNGYVHKVLTSPDVKPEHVEIAKSMFGVEVDLGNKETHIGDVSANATPVVTTEKNILGSSTVKTPTNEFTEDAIKEQVNPMSLVDVLHKFGLYIVIGIVSIIVIVLAFINIYIITISKRYKEMKDVYNEVKKAYDEIKRN